MATWRHRSRLIIFMTVLFVVVLSAGWFLFGRAFNNSLVDGAVSDAALVWHPGVNSGGPEQLTDVDAAPARRLADLVNHSGKLPDGPISCPADFGSTVRVAFHRPNQHQAVTIALTGCAGPPGHVMSDALRQSGHPLMPLWAQRRGPWMSQSGACHEGAALSDAGRLSQSRRGH